MHITFVILDIILPLCYSLTYFLINFYYNDELLNTPHPPKLLLRIYLASFYSRGILLMISACFLADSIFRMRRVIKKVDNAVILNQKNFIAHLLVLGLFILSTFGFYLMFTYANFKPYKI